jgi:hypothetical protein
MLVKERGLSSRATQEVARNGKLGHLSIPLKVQKLQMALQAKAKENPGFRFYALYDKIHRKDILQFAYASCKAAPVDAQLSVGESMSLLSGSRVRQNRMLGSMSGDWKRGMVEILWHSQTKGRVTREHQPQPGVPFLDFTLLFSSTPVLQHRHGHA